MSKVVHETKEPVFLTKNGYGDMVVMSMEAYEENRFLSEIYYKLKESEVEGRLLDEIRCVPIKKYLLFYILREDTIEIRRFIYQKKRYFG